MNEYPKIMYRSSGGSGDWHAFVSTAEQRIVRSEDEEAGARLAGFRGAHDAYVGTVETPEPMPAVAEEVEEESKSGK